MESNSSASRNLEHIGIARRSGRYPWGSGETPVQRSRDFKSYYDQMKSKGLTDTQIAEGIGMHVAKATKGENLHPSETKFTTSDLRAAISVSTEHIYADNQARAYYLTSPNNEGGRQLSVSAAARTMKVNESTVRGWLKDSDERRANSLRATADALKENLESKEFLDVGRGTHLSLNVTDTKLRQAIAMLRDEGYPVYSGIKSPQLGTDKFTNLKVLCKPGATWHDANAAVKEGRLRIVDQQSDDHGATFKKPSKDAPISLDLKRVEVAYKEHGGAAKDGVIEIRRGVEDLSLGSSRYAQVRVAVNGTHYLKGMAMYADDLPKGVDVRFNTNKSQNDPKVLKDGKLGAMKPLKEDKSTGKVDTDNPFGASIRRTGLYTDKHGKDKTSPLNIVNEEGSWDGWSKSLSSQMLSKQSLSLASTQLKKAESKRVDELNKILKMTNPVVKEKLLMEFSDKADSAAIHLKAAALDRQATHVILPINSIRPHEVYAPNFKPGEKVVLVRHPHGGPFEIPELTVNNRNPEAKRILGGALDAIGIHHSVAEQLSGADFDGDTVLVIPNDSRKVKTRPPLDGLKGFNPQEAYPKTAGMKVMSKKDTQREMGRISNLITDMSIHGAHDDELARAVRHSMVVIDAEKHELNYKLSEKKEAISQLKEKYQNGSRNGASTLISRSSATARIDQRKQPSGNKGINPKTGEKVFVPTERQYTRPIKDKNGNPTGKFEVVKNTTKGTRMEFVNDARRLLSGGDERSRITKDRGQPMERIYADYANSMKGLANAARKEQVKLVMPKQSKLAKELYSKEVDSLKAKLRVALRNAPLERRAQIIGKAMYEAKIAANPGEDDDSKKKIRFQSLEDARNFTGANKQKIGSRENPLTNREWDAIQAGAVSSTTLREILRSADMDRVRELATPRVRTAMTSGQVSLARQMAARGRSVADISEALGIPRSTVVDNMKNA